MIYFHENTFSFSVQILRQYKQRRELNSKPLIRAAFSDASCDLKCVRVILRHYSHLINQRCYFYKAALLLRSVRPHFQYEYLLCCLKDCEDGIWCQDQQTVYCGYVCALQQTLTSLEAGNELSLMCYGKHTFITATESTDIEPHQLLC